jgi:hypothetical protein
MYNHARQYQDENPEGKWPMVTPGAAACGAWMMIIPDP